MSTISAIIPTYNRAAMLHECIESILDQTRKVDQIIVVNDGSTDDTENVVKSYGNRITLINKPNGGKASAVNLALRQCKEDYVWICDDDDVAAPDGLTYLAAALDSEPEAGFAFGTFNIFHDDAKGRHFKPPTYWMREGEPDYRIQFFEELFTFPFAMLIRRTLFEKIGPYREELVRSADYDTAIRLARAAKSIYVPQVIFFQRKHEGQRGPASDSFKANQSMRKWLEYDQKIFSRIRREYALEEFTPTFARGWDTARAKRAALVERACVCAERALWEEAIADFREAAALSADVASAQELRIAEAVIRKPLTWEILGAHKELIVGLYNCYRTNEYGHQIIFAACRPLVWLARKNFQEANIRDGFRMLGLLRGVLGVKGMFSRIISSLLG